MAKFKKIKAKKKKKFARMWIGEPSFIFVGSTRWYSTVEISVAVLQNTRNRLTLYFNYTT